MVLFSLKIFRLHNFFPPVRNVPTLPILSSSFQQTTDFSQSPTSLSKYSTTRKSTHERLSYQPTSTRHSTHERLFYEHTSTRHSTFEHLFYEPTSTRHSTRERCLTNPRPPDTRLVIFDRPENVNWGKESCKRRELGSIRVRNSKEN